MEKSWRPVTRCLVEVCDALGDAMLLVEDLPERGKCTEIHERIKCLLEEARQTRSLCALQESREIAAARQTRGVPARECYEEREAT